MHDDLLDSLSEEIYHVKIRSTKNILPMMSDHFHTQAAIEEMV
jgi:hypothetical protein